MPALLPGERVLKASDNGVLELTNYRVRFNAAETGASKHLSIPLDAVASCGLITRTKPWLLAVAGICLVVAGVQYKSPIAGLMAVLAIAFVVAYFLTRSGVITVSSSGGEDIVIPASGMNSDQITPFLDAVLEAKLQLIDVLPDAGLAGERSSAQARAAA